MIHFVFSEKDRRYVFLKYDTHTEYVMLHNQLKDKLNLIDPICYLPTFTGIPFRQEFLWEYRQPSGNIIFYAPLGMWYCIWQYFKENNIAFDGLDQSMFKRNDIGTLDDFKAVVNSWGLSKDPRPYQYEAAYNTLCWKQSLSELCTRAGKTLIAYMIFRYSFERLGAKRILMIVPSIELVKQGFDDFNEYGEFFKTECIWSGGKVVQSSNLTIATFQSLVNFLDPKSKKYNPSFFNGYDVVFVDETHRANSKSIKTIISQDFMKSVKLSFGMTGTLPKPWTIEAYCLHSLFGAKIQQIRAKDLMDEGYLSKLHIYQHRLMYKNYDEQIKTWCRCAEYAVSQFVEVPNKNNPKKKDKVPLEHPEFLIAYKKDFPFGLQRAKELIFSTGDNMDNWLRYKKLLEDAIKISSAANKLHVEVMMVHFMEQRIDYLIEQLDKCPNNTLILATHVEYIKHIGERLRIAFPDRPVVVVYGSSKERKMAKTVFKENNDAIMVANYGIMGTGITLSNLCYGFLFESYKSGTINIQSIGRGLGLSDLKEEYKLHDIVDAFSPKFATNKILGHGKERCKIYDEQQYSYDIIEKTIS